MSNWNTDSTSCGQTLGTVVVKRGIFQGDSLSPLIFIFCIVPKPYECDILGIAEIHWNRVGEIGGGEVVWSSEDKDHERGVGFLDCLR